MQSLNFKSKRSYVNGNIVTTGKIQSYNTIEELQKNLTEREGFCPIGDRINNYGYQGNFDGNIKGISKGGGIIGYNDWGEVTLENCYNIGTISGEYKGGISGRLFLTNDMLATKNCFYLNKDISIGIGYIHGGNEEKEDITGMNENELKSNETLTKLNDYVKENSTSQEVVLKSWKSGADGSPTFAED